MRPLLAVSLGVAGTLVGGLAGAAVAVALAPVAAAGIALLRMRDVTGSRQAAVRRA